MLHLTAAFLATANAPSSCAGRVPQRTTVATIAQNPEMFIGRCVHVIGYSNGRTLFGDERSLRRHEAMRSMVRSGERLSDRMLAVYDLPEVSEPVLERQRERGLHWDLVGLVETCGRMQRRAQMAADAGPGPDGAIVLVMMRGHCHYLDGPALLVAQGRVIDLPTGH